MHADRKDQCAVSRRNHTCLPPDSLATPHSCANESTSISPRPFRASGSSCWDRSPPGGSDPWSATPTSRTPSATARVTVGSLCAWSIAFVMSSLVNNMATSLRSANSQRARTLRTNRHDRATDDGFFSNSSLVRRHTETLDLFVVQRRYSQYQWSICEGFSHVDSGHGSAITVARYATTSFAHSLFSQITNAKQRDGDQELSHEFSTTIVGPSRHELRPRASQGSNVGVGVVWRGSIGGGSWFANTSSWRTADEISRHRTGAGEYLW